MSDMSIPTLHALCERLEAVARQATQGEWRVIGAAGGHLVELPLTNKEYPKGRIRWCPSLTYEHRDSEPANAAHIVALQPHTVLTEIVPALRLAVEREERWERLKAWRKGHRTVRGSGDYQQGVADALELLEYEMARLEESPLPAPPARLEGEK